MLKRQFDVVGAALLLLVTWPFAVVIFLAVWSTSAGPVIYRQKRLGFKGEPFTIYKFRTLYPYNGPYRPVTPGDPRVTQVGRFLRRTHLDELPQLINVVLGDMSLVGPRPTTPEAYAEWDAYIPDQARRMKIKPGLTGLHAIGRPRSSGLEGRRQDFRLDMEYIDRPSLWADLVILVKTVPEVFLGRSF